MMAELVGEGKLVTPNAVLSHQQPAGETRSDVAATIAQRGVGGLVEKGVSKTQKRVL
jgi:hypothetical protein